ncbi:TPA: substrate-binding domain-containing protein, partial [Streptococcus suis]
FTALDTLAVLEKLGRRVPEDVQVIGYDGIQLASERSLELSTIRQPLEAMAQEAVACLVDIIEKRERSLQVTLPISYLEGKTTKNF